MSALTYLLDFYFNQDFYDEYGGPWETVDAFGLSEPERARQVPAEVDALISRLPNDEDLEAWVRATGTAVRPPDGDYRAFLREVAHRLRSHSAERQAAP